MNEWRHKNQSHDPGHPLIHHCDTLHWIGNHHAHDVAFSLGFIWKSTERISHELKDMSFEQVESWLWVFHQYGLIERRDDGK